MEAPVWMIGRTTAGRIALMLSVMAALLALAAWSAREAAAADGLGLSAGGKSGQRVTVDAGSGVTLRARWSGAEALPRGARIQIRYTKANVTGTDKPAAPSSRRRTCAVGAKICIWKKELSKVATSRAYQAVVVVNGRTTSRSSRTIVVRWRARVSTKPSPAQPSVGAAPSSTPVQAASGPANPGPANPGPANPGPTDPGPTDPGPTDPGPTGPRYPNLNPYVFDFLSPVRVVTGGGTHSVVAEDVDKDGDADLVAAASDFSQVRVALNNGDQAGTFAASTPYAVGLAPKDAVTGDLNGDGWPDIVSANQDHNSISVLFNNGNGTFAFRVSRTVCTGPHEVAVAQLNGSGPLDIGVACWGGSQTTVLLTDGTTAVAGWQLSSYAVGLGGHSLTFGDFDRDGDADMAQASLSDNDISVVLNNGNGSFGPLNRYPVPGEPHSIRSADLNGDSDLDLVAVLQNRDTVVVRLGSAGGTFGAPVEYSVGANTEPKGVALADLNNDGEIDIVTANSHGNYPDGVDPTTLTVLTGDGDGAFVPGLTLNVNQTPFGIAVADYNQDGRPDIASAQWLSGDVRIFRHR